MTSEELRGGARCGTAPAVCGRNSCVNETIQPMILPHDVCLFTASELWSIFVMQGFAGLSLFSVLLLMALGLAIIFGQMGVVNLAHGEFMALGAYTVYLCSQLVAQSRSRAAAVLLHDRHRRRVRRRRHWSGCWWNGR